jgi:ammonium transporter, Amt family
MLHSQFIHKTHKFSDICNGLLCGCVSITASGCFIAPWAGILVGFLGALIFLYMEPFIASLGIDDAVGASSMHGCIGTFGTLVPGFFARADYTRELFHSAGIGLDNPDKLMAGIFYGGDGNLLGCQVIGALITSGTELSAPLKSHVCLNKMLAMSVIRACQSDKQP